MRTPIEVIRRIATEAQGVFDEPDTQLVRDERGRIVDLTHKIILPTPVEVEDTDEE